MLSSRRSALGPSRGGIVAAATRISRVPARDLKHRLPAVTRYHPYRLTAGPRTVMTSNFNTSLSPVLRAYLSRLTSQFPRAQGIPEPCTRGSPRVLIKRPSSSHPEHEQTSLFLPPSCLTLVPLPPTPRHPISN